MFSVHLQIFSKSYVNFRINMPTGEEFSVEQKTLIFRVIEFVESERNGLKIPLTSTSARVMALLGISYSSVHRLKKEVKDLRQEQTMESTTEDEEFVPEESIIRTRAHSASVFAPTGRRKTKKTWSARKIASVVSTDVPMPIAPKKKGNVGRRQVVLSEAGEDAIRYHFHLILVRTTSDTYVILRSLFQRLSDAIRLSAIFLQVL
jgi:hypothetical protein